MDSRQGREPLSTNLDLVRSIYAANERGDFSSADWAHPEIEWIIADGPTAGRWTGMTAMKASFRRMLDAWEDLRIHAEEFRELDDERVLVLINRSGRGKMSGVGLGELHTGGAVLYHVRDGKVTRLVNYYDRSRAFADLGLTPEAP